MKNKILKASLIGAMLALTGLQAFAGAALRNFNITNLLIGTTSSITSWPTNQVGTNGVGYQTGGPVNIANFDNLGLNFQGLLVSTNGTNIVGFTVDFSCANNTPAIVLGTNVYSSGNTVTNQNDWVTASNNTMQVIFTFGSATNGQWVNGYTNLSSSQLPAGATFLGITAITNNFSVAGNFITNASLTGNTKLLPKPLIAQ